MLFVVIFKDKLNRSDVRENLLQAHIEWLEEHRAIIPIGGSLRHEPEQNPIGGLWIAEAASKQELEKLVHTDPFFTAGLRESYDILHWSKANEGRKVSI